MATCGGVRPPTDDCDRSSRSGTTWHTVPAGSCLCSLPLLPDGRHRLLIKFSLSSSASPAALVDAATRCPLFVGVADDDVLRSIARLQDGSQSDECGMTAAEAVVREWQSTAAQDITKSGTLLELVVDVPRRIVIFGRGRISTLPVRFRDGAVDSRMHIVVGYPMLLRASSPSPQPTDACRFQVAASRVLSPNWLRRAQPVPMTAYAAASGVDVPQDGQPPVVVTVPMRRCYPFASPIVRGWELLVESGETHVHFSLRRLNDDQPAPRASLVRRMCKQIWRPRTNRSQPPAAAGPGDHR